MKLQCSYNLFCAQIQTTERKSLPASAMVSPTKRQIAASKSNLSIIQDLIEEIFNFTHRLSVVFEHFMKHLLRLVLRIFTNICLINTPGK